MMETDRMSDTREKGRWIPWVTGVAVLAGICLIIFAAGKVREQVDADRILHERIASNDIKSVTVYGHTAYCIGGKPHIITGSGRFFAMSVRDADNPCKEGAK